MPSTRIWGATGVRQCVSARWLAELSRAIEEDIRLPGLADLPILAQALAACTSAGLECSVFSEVKPNPTGTNVEQGVGAFKDGAHDGVIAFGGGSAPPMSLS